MPHSIDASQENVDKFDMEASEDTTSPGKEGGGDDVTEICQGNDDNNHNNNNNVSGRARGFDGSCGSSSSSGDGGGSDDDDDRSEDSYRSEEKSRNNCSPKRNVECQQQTLIKSNGVQMKAKSIENDERCKDSIDENISEQNDLGGKLSFYLEGRCVLELRHNFNNDGHAKQWVQSFGKTYRPPVASSMPTTCIPAWQPQESSLQENEKMSEDKVVNNSSPTSIPTKKKAFNNFYLTFFARKRCRATSQEVAEIGIPHCILRKAVRRPSDVVYKELSCSHDTKCNRPRTKRRGTTNFIQKSLKLSLCIDKLVQLSEANNNDNKMEKIAGSSEKLLTHRKENGAYKNVPSHISSSEHNLAMDIQDETEKSKMRRPLPEWYFDPSKATIPLEEMIGIPRPSLMSAEKCSASHSNKRSPEQLNLLSPETKRQAKDDIDKLNGDLKNPTSHRCGGTQVKPLPANTHSGEIKELEKCQSQVNTDTSAKTNEVQRKKKKGGGYGRGRTIGEAVRTYVISEILNLGGDVRTNYVPRGVFTEVASRYKIDATTTYRWWLKYCNGIRMAASGNLDQLDASHKGFLLNRITNVPVVVPDSKHKTNKPNKEVNACHPLHLIESSILKREQLTGRTSSIPHPHGGRYSPRSDDSVSSGASLVDPTSLYVSSINLAPHSGVWPANVPLSVVSNSQSHFQSDRMAVPIGIAPYIWNGSAEVSRINGNELKTSSVNLDEPLDLTVPKKEKLESNCPKKETIKVLNTGLGTYSECPSDQYILRTLLSSQGQHPTGFNNLVEKEARYSIGKPFAKSLAQKNMKPKHYTFLSLQIGSFEIHSNLEGSQTCQRDTFKDIPNKFKVIFTQRKFVYEFEIDADMHLPHNECNQKDLQVSAKRMACIVVPFNIVEAFWCYGATIVLRVVSKPFMFLGRKLKQVGCVPSLTVYETKKSVDLTGGQLSMAQLHKVTLIKPHLIEQLKIYLVLFDVRFRNLICPSSQSLLTTDDIKPTDPAETQD